MSRRALLLLLPLACAHAPPAPAPAADIPDREQRELQLVELAREGLTAPPTEPAAAAAMQEEMKSLLVALSGFAPSSAPPDEETREEATLKAVLARRDPALAEAVVCRMNQSEARIRLRSIFTNELEWKGEHDTFTRDPKVANPDEALELYDVAILDANPNHLRVRATGHGEMAGDVWEIDQDGNAKNTENGCKPYPPVADGGMSGTR